MSEYNRKVRVALISRKPGYREVYAAGESAGFSINDARQYYRNEDGNQPRLEQTITTPWTFQGQPVIGYTDTSLSEKDRDRETGLRFTDLREFYIADKFGSPRNVDDVQPNGRKVFQDAQGRSIDMYDAQDKMGAFASAASEYPHGFTYEEYMESRSFINGRLGMDPPNEDDYNVYLESVERQLASRDIKFVGAVTRTSDMFKLQQTCPSFQEGMDDFLKSINENPNNPGPNGYGE